jgi:hypothetical protein
MRWSGLWGNQVQSGAGEPAQRHKPLAFLLGIYVFMCRLSPYHNVCLTIRFLDCFERIIALYMSKALSSVPKRWMPNFKQLVLSAVGLFYSCSNAARFVYHAAHELCQVHLYLTYLKHLLNLPSCRVHTNDEPSPDNISVISALQPCVACDNSCCSCHYACELSHTSFI